MGVFSMIIQACGGSKKDDFLIFCCIPVAEKPVRARDARTGSEGYSGQTNAPEETVTFLLALAVLTPSETVTDSV